jgi:hypothetical protein
MAASLASLNAVLKESYVIDKIEDQFNENVDAWKDFDAQELNWTGKQAIFPLRVARNNSVSSTSTNTTPTAGEQGYLSLTITAAKVYGSVQIDGISIASAKDKAGSFVIEPTAELDGLVQDFTKKLTELTFFGGTCIGYVWQKQNAAGFGYSGRWFDIGVGAGYTVGFFRMDTYLQVGVNTQLNAISATTLTLNAAINTAAVPAGVLMAVVVAGTQAAAVSPINPGTSAAGIDPALSTEPRGFIGNLSLQDHFGANRNTNVPVGSTVLRSNFRAVNDALAAGGALGLDDVSGMRSQILTLSGKRPSNYWISWQQLISYENLLQGTAAGNLRTDVKTPAGKADPSYTDFANANIPFKGSDTCPNGLIFAINKESWTRATLGGGGEWIDFGEGPITRIPNTDSAQGTYRRYYNLLCRQPNANGVIAALETPA